MWRGSGVVVELMKTIVVEAVGWMLQWSCLCEGRNLCGV